MFRLYLIISALLLVVSIGYGQAIKTIYHPTLCIDHAIHNDTVWALTRWGLAKYLLPDGKLLETYDPGNAPLPRDFGPTAIAIDADNGVWISYYVEGVACLKNGKWKWWPKDKIEPKPSVKPYLHKMAVDGKGRIWVGAYNIDAVYRLEDSTWSKIPIPSGSLRRFKVDPIGRIWMIRSENLYVYSDTIWTKITEPELNNKFIDVSFLSDGTALCLSASKKIWHYTTQGPPELWSIVPSTVGSTTALAIDTVDGSAWVASYNSPGKLWNLRDSSWKDFATPYYFFNVGAIGKISLDRFRRPFFSPGSLYGALGHVSSIGIQYYVPDVPSSESIAADQLGNVWFENQGFFSKMNINSNQIEYHAGSQSVAMAADQMGRLYTSTKDGLNLFDGIVSQNVIPGIIFQSIKVSPSGKVYACAGSKNYPNQLYKYDPASGQKIIFRSGENGLPNDTIRSFAVDQSEILWVCTGIGDFYSFSKHKWIKTHPFTAIVTTLVAGPNGNIFTYIWNSNSVYQYDGSEWITLQPPLSSGKQTVNSLFVDSRNWIWMARKNGDLAMYNGLNWRVYDSVLLREEIEGVPTFAEDANGDIWVGCKRMTLQIKTASLAENLHAHTLPGGLAVTPNPSRGRAFIRCQTDKHISEGNWMIFDVNGRLVRQWPMEGTETTVERNDLPIGIYQIILTVDDRIYASARIVFVD